ncbi:MAG: MFS transporter [Proteobacteria bacterium]|nr:MFS transporter [Pseudomonadota bacterium]
MTERARSPVEAQRVDGYLVLLFVLLSTATLFDGFDSALFGFAAPEVRETLGISLEDWGYVSAATRFGVMASFLFLLSADRFGRRAVLLFTVVGFTVFNGLTALVTETWQFTLCQMLARLFLTAEYALAIVTIGEEFPAAVRGRAIAILTSLATVGVMVMAKLQPYLLLPEGAPGNWLHDTGAAGVSVLQGALGLERDGESWRALYLLGAVPLVIVLVLRVLMRETRRFEAVQEDRGTRGWQDHARDALLPFRRAYRRRSAIVILLWNCVFIVTGPSVVYWVIFAREELGLTASQVGDVVFWGYAGGVAGHFVAGDLVDRIGRKGTCAAFYALASASILLLYQVPTLWGQYVFMIATVFCFGAAMTATHVYASELFPTEIRATGYGWTTNFFGRVTEVLTPAAIGFLIPWFGIPNAIAVVAVGPLLGAILVYRYAPETRGLTLEQVQEKLALDAR